MEAACLNAHLFIIFNMSDLIMIVPGPRGGSLQWEVFQPRPQRRRQGRGRAHAPRCSLAQDYLPLSSGHCHAN